ncbi:hypothetical protein BDV96DRAFT_172098 [Lophiotrema nucula]|uniref:F-box domain-containing protein n=1 Tax=Lophiotrema nucula TaxID=690887 RepID=A0A6A5YZI0_9PLEO|nr:hypothetical protein BDV96DRAFT_172098 [Lophiotrema nucula]
MEGEFGLAQLPEEIIDIICESLEAQDVTNLRYTCRSLQAKSDHQWALKFFGQTSFVLTRRSLTLLIELSKNERFAPCIRELQLVLVTFPPSKLSGILGTPLSEPMDVDNGKSSHASALAKKQGDRKKLEGKPEEPSTSQMIKRQRRATYQRNMHDQNMLRKRGIDIDMLTEALQNLGGLESFSILDQYRYVPG